MAVRVGRLGWTGIGIETTGGVPVNPSDYVPHVDNTLQGKHEPLGDVAARGLRDQNFDSVIGKKWGEGSLETNADPQYAGYHFKMAVGTEANAQIGATGVYDHTFTVNNSSVPTSATIMVDKGAYREIYPFSVVDELELNVADGLATIKSAIKSQFPATTTSGTNTTASGIVFSFRDMTIQFGATLTAAQSAAATRVTKFNLKIKTNAEPIFKSGDANVADYGLKSLEVSGTYGLMLEDQTEVNKYYNLTKQAAIITLRGRGIGSSLFEQITINLYKFRLNEAPIDTGIDNLFAFTGNFVAEYSNSDSKTLDIVVRNRKSSVY